MGHLSEAEEQVQTGFSLRSLNGAAGKVLFLLPEMEGGSHTITLQNTDLRRTFIINSVRILKHEGQSADGCEVPEWLHDYLGKENGLNNCPATSLTSPLCVEGKARALHLAKVTTNGTERKIEAGAGTGWYANVDLPADGSALPVTATFESGAHATTANVSWVACDLLTHGEVTLRQGDSLRVCVGVEDSGEAAFPVTITVDGTGAIETNSDIPIPVKFETPGLHTVRADWKTADGTAARATMNVHAVGVELGEAMDFITGLRQTVTLTAIPAGVLLQNAAPLRAEQSLSAAPAGTRNLDITSDKGGAQHLVARLGETGSILDTLGFFSHTNSGTSTLSCVEPVMDYGDGSSLMCLYLASKSLSDAVEFDGIGLGGEDDGKGSAFFSVVVQHFVCGYVVRKEAAEVLGFHVLVQVVAFPFHKVSVGVVKPGDVFLGMFFVVPGIAVFGYFSGIMRIHVSPCQMRAPGVLAGSMRSGWRLEDQFSSCSSSASTEVLCSLFRAQMTARF